MIKQDQKNGFTYTDGMVEDQILSYLIDHHGETDGIIESIPAGAVFHNFCQARENLINWYPFADNAHVLEIGAGMGALTPYLAEKCAQVTAVEPSTKRAEIIRKRCIHNDNVEVVESIEQLSEKKEFDYVLLIGVLEYAGITVDSENPWSTLLASAASKLKEGGKILLAIENKYGLKYWCGASEDHTSIPFDSISDYQKSKGNTARFDCGEGVRTFSHNELQSMLSGAGLTKQKFYYPLPDYKFPMLILTDQSRDKEEFIDSVKFSYPSESTLIANEKNIYPEIIKNGAFGFFANSFFIEASTGAVLSDITTAVIKRDYKPEYRLCTVFKKDKVYRSATGCISKEHLIQLVENTKKLEEKGIKCVEQTTITNGYTVSPCIQGLRADIALKEAAEKKDEKTFRAILNELRAAVENSSEQEKIKSDIILKDGYLDLTLKNSFWVNGKLLFFDQEWIEPNIPEKYLLFRSVRYSLSEADRRDAYAFLGITEADEEEFEKREAIFLECLMDSTNCQWFDGNMFNEGLTLETKSNAEKNNLKAHIEQLIQSERNLKIDLQIAKSELQNANNEIKNKQGHINILLESDRELQRIHHSRSWKVLTYWWKFRDFIIPPNSKRRLILKLVAKFVRHPIWCLKRLDWDHTKKFVNGMRSGSIMSTSARLDNYLGGSSITVEKPDQLPLINFERIEDVPQLHVPTATDPTVSIIIPVYNQFAYTYACLKSIAKNSGGISYEVILADDCSTDLTSQIEKAVSGITVIHNTKNLRFLLNCNHAAKEAKGKYILFLNNDTQVTANWLQPLVSLIESNDNIGMVGSKLIYPDGRLQEAGGIVWKDASAWNYGHLDDPTKPEYNYVKEADYISGAAIMIRTDLWNQLGGFDKQFAPAYYEDTDLAFMVRKAGYRVMFQPLSVVIHFEGVSNGTDTSSGQKAYQEKNQNTFRKKWETVLESEQDENGQNVFKAKDRSQRKKHLLVVDHYVPHYDKDAGGRCTYMYLKLFVKLGFKVTFIGDNFFRHEPYTTELNQMGIEVLYGNWYYANWQNWLKENGKTFDYIYLQRPHISIKYIDIVKEYSNAKIIYFAHDLHHIREKREYEITGDEKLLQSAEEWKKKEYKLFNDADVGHVVGSYEQAIMQKAFPDKPIRNIPLYLYEKLPDNINKDFLKRKDLLYVGGFNHHPNVDAVVWFANEIFPIIQKKYPDIVWHLIGGHLTKEVEELANEHIILHGFVSDEELEYYYRTCRIAVVPLRYGAGVKGKVIEANYYQIPLVTTTIGAEGISLEEDSMIVEDDAQTMAETICSLYEDQDSLKRLSDNSEKLIRNHYLVNEAERIIKLDFQP